MIWMQVDAPQLFDRQMTTANSDVVAQRHGYALRDYLSVPVLALVLFETLLPSPSHVRSSRAFVLCGSCQRSG